MSENLLTLTIDGHEVKASPIRQSSKPMHVRAMRLLPTSAAWVKAYAVPAAV